jgi:uncharacterized membrane protein
VPDRLQVKLLGQVDLAYQLALIGSLATGLARALYYGQNGDYYLANRLFWLKIALFVAVAVTAIGPALQYIRWNREAGSAPAFAPLTRDVERVRRDCARARSLADPAADRDPRRPRLRLKRGRSPIPRFQCRL